jgi:hypothetical protein
VVRVPNEGAAAARARWLAELAEALEEARQVMKQLGAAAGRIEMVELYNRIDALALDVETMRRMRSARSPEHVRPEWSKNIPWSLTA